VAGGQYASQTGGEAGPKNEKEEINDVILSIKKDLAIGVRWKSANVRKRREEGKKEFRERDLITEEQKGKTKVGIHLRLSDRGRPSNNKWKQKTPTARRNRRGRKTGQG